MTIMIDSIDFFNCEAMKYWTFPKTYDPVKRKEEAKQMCLSGNYIGSRKIDGAWNMLIKDKNGNFHLRSRTKNVNGSFEDKAEWVPQICQDLINLPNETVIIGEIYLPNNEGSRNVTTVFNCLKDKSLQRQKKNPLYFYIFDVLAYDGKSLISEKFENRIVYLNTIIENCNPSYVTAAIYKEGNNLWELYGNTIDCGGEGIVITKKDSTYIFGKRPARMTLKMKKELQDTIDAFIDGNYKRPTRLYDGKMLDSWCYWENFKTGEKFNENKYKEYITGVPIEPVTKAYYNNWAAAISLSVIKDNKPFHIAWISGIDETIKEQIIKAPEKLIGKVCTLTAMEVEKIDGQYSLRHGRILNFRDDKSIEDCTFSQIEQN